MTEPSRSEIWLIEPESLPPEGDEELEEHDSGDVRREVRGYRPGLIISANRLNESPAGMAIIAPCTSRIRQFPDRVTVEPPEGGLDRTTEIMCSQIRSIDKSRLSRNLGAISRDTMNEVEEIVRRLLAF